MQQLANRISGWSWQLTLTLVGILGALTCFAFWGRRLKTLEIEKLQLQIQELHEKNSRLHKPTPEEIDRIIREHREMLGPVPVSTTNGVLMILIRSLDESVASWAASKLAEMGPAAAPAVPALIKLLDWRHTCPDWWFSDSEWKLIRDRQKASAQLRYQVAETLGAIGPAAADATSILVETLNDSDDDVEVLGQAAQTLELIGVKSEDVREALSKATQHAHPCVSKSADRALKALS